VRVLTAQLPNLHWALDAADNSGEHAFVARMANALRQFYPSAMPGREAESCLNAGVRNAQAIGDRLMEANCIRGLAEVHIGLAEYPQARDRYQQALPICQDIGDRLGEANCIRGLGDVHRMHSEYRQARDRYQQALPIYQDIGSRLGEANCIWSLGDVHRVLAEYPQARDRYQGALPIYQGIRDRYSQAGCHRSLGLLATAEGNREEAIREMQEAAMMFGECGVEVSAERCRRQAEDWQKEE
jgi:tetratricopeptide (TPR) repeat protein